MKVSDFLEEARGRVEKAWVKQAWRDGESACALGALERTAMAHLSDNAPALVVPAQELLTRRLGDFGDFSAVWSFNDDPATARQDVLDLFTKAINDAQEAGL